MLLYYIKSIIDIIATKEIIITQNVFLREIKTILLLYYYSDIYTAEKSFFFFYTQPLKRPFMEMYIEIVL